MGNKIRRYASAMLGLLLLVYVGYQIFGDRNESVQTETASYASVQDSFETLGFAIRDESVISFTDNGVLDFSVDDGQRVAANQTIADVYDSEEDAMINKQINHLDSEIALLKSLSNPGDTHITQPAMINSQINSSLENLLLGINQQDYSGLQESREKFQLAVNNKKVITQVESPEDYNYRIAELEAKISELRLSKNDAKSSVVAPDAGYFISKVDGFEGVVDIDKVNELTVTQVQKLLDTRLEDNDSSNSGKICKNFKWYIVCVLDENQTIGIEGLNSVELEIPFASSSSLPAKIVAANTDPATKETAVVFECNNMNSDIAKVRNETIKVITGTYSGVMVNQSAIHFLDIEKEVTAEDGSVSTQVHKNIKGVYVRNGDRLKFVQIFTYKTINGYAICKTDAKLTDEERAELVTESTLTQYDLVVISGSDLYDSKLL